jgi:protein phosphatase 1G
LDKRLETPEGRAEVKAIHEESKNSPIFEQENGNELANNMGCTSCVALITKTEIYVANAGDSRCVLSKNGVAINLSEDHKPDLENEKKRIEKAEGFVEDNRVNGVLSLSRSLGDLDYKRNTHLPAEEQMITAFPDVKVDKITNEYDFIVIACDGVWDCMTSQGVVDFFKEQVTKMGPKPDKSFKYSKIIETLLDKLIPVEIGAQGGLGCDNMTCILISFNKPK